MAESLELYFLRPELESEDSRKEMRSSLDFHNVSRGSLMQLTAVRAFCFGGGYYHEPNIALLSLAYGEVGWVGDFHIKHRQEDAQTHS